MENEPTDETLLLLFTVSENDVTVIIPNVLK